MRVRLSAAALGIMCLCGCAGPGFDSQALDEARVRVAGVEQNAAVQRAAHLEVERAVAALAQAEAASRNWRQHGDVAHLAYLSKAQSDVALAQTRLVEVQARNASLTRELARVQHAVDQARLAHRHNEAAGDDFYELSDSDTDTDKELVITLGDTVFDSGSTDLNPDASPLLVRLARFLDLEPTRRIRIEGYTDNVGTPGDNLALSQVRAQVVADTLADLGVDASRIEVTGFGDAYPVAENTSEEGRAQNRRVEIVLSDSEGRLGSSH
ncbi:OmpA family protein [Pseudomonas sp. Marseille-QA0892]